MLKAMGAKVYVCPDFQTTLGAKFKFLIFSAFIDFTFQDYKTLSAGISINFR